ncbi:hypothetical protein JYU34_002378 [Plutella xylostella]|uniref:Uncharacterized protein n=1 Tax=Plutella xylostella TaxID=51655 RepID=A0ABQ7QVK6_PLUXY|nr:uncharacterized protein LOC105385281 isoform X1 [Plutella xylostella]XP_037969437.1 uncharacterized protein LOC105387425 isoform X1 [Plutella xylostella]KAG7297518.1 hypothetical protein JYU34_019531 [Plutella xylostella]KAG7309090.1 hypothetical protein JYU34_005003 [Plutella xylostella]KAG7311340.1 hypothetical protein JYU34_002378 [Plutella xylostella]
MSLLYCRSDGEGFYSSEEELPRRRPVKPAALSAAPSTSTAPAPTPSGSRKRKTKASESASESRAAINKGKQKIDLATYNRRKATVAALFGGSDDEAEAAAALNNPIQELESSLTRKVGDGSLRRTAKLDGSLFCELRVYEVRDIKNISPRDRWTKAYTSLKYQFDYDSPEWTNIIDFIRVAKTRFTQEPIYYPNKK